MTPAAKEKKHQAEQNKQEPEGAGPENQRPGTRKAPPQAGQDRERTKHPGRNTFRLFWSAGSWVGALCTVLGTAPEGSAAEPPRAALLNPPPFECPLGNSSTTVVQRRASREHLPGDSTTTVVSRGLGE